MYFPDSKQPVGRGSMGRWNSDYSSRQEALLRDSMVLLQYWGKLKWVKAHLV
jgi:hypothetical protein